MISQHRYEVLDGLRGIAAVGVTLFHLTIIGLPIARHGYLAVDFFFILSGFVLAHAYTNRLPSIGFFAFLRQRLIRIMPLSVLGLFFGSSYFLLRYFTQDKSMYSLNDIMLSTVFNLFLIPKPWMTPAPTDTIFPSNTPLWSLSLEVFINFAWALLLYRIQSYLLIIIVALSAVCLCVITIYHGTADIGATWPTYFGGVSRVIFGFFTGILIWRYRPQPVKSFVYYVSAAFLLVCILICPDFGPIFDVVAIGLGFPFIVSLAISANYRSERRLFRLIGNISYPLYAIHVPLLMFAAGFAKLFKLNDHVYALALASVLVCLITSFLLYYIYDRPLRKILTRVFVP
ncbi:acyltransferase [Bosea sp. LjRoot9]|uniref:acyltransferase family protein n=1 Tax=Bosea sp. LjRoot9 TaxID=3342341 RepID=UPI003ECCD970